MRNSKLANLHTFRESPVNARFRPPPLYKIRRSAYRRDRLHVNGTSGYFAKLSNSTNLLPEDPDCLAQPRPRFGLLAAGPIFNRSSQTIPRKECSTRHGIFMQLLALVHILLVSCLTPHFHISSLQASSLKL